MLSFTLLLAGLLASRAVFATEDSLRKASYSHLHQFLEDLDATPEQAEEALDYFDILSFNTDFDREELSALPGISLATAFSLSRTDTLNWMRLNDGLSNRQSQLVSSLVAKGSKYLWSSRSRLQLDPNARDEKGYNDGRILGDQHKLYDWLLLSQYGFRAGVLQAKDAGERRTFDHLRGYLQMHEKQTLLGQFAVDQAIIGDYSLGFGSGLLFSAGGMQGKSSEVIDVVESNQRGIQGYLSSSIASGFRGAAASFSLGPLRSSFFYSNRSYDARVDSGSITSLPLDGYHRTESEESKIDIAKSRLIGSSMSYLMNNVDFSMRLDATAFKEVFAMPVKTGGFAHNFSGKSLSMLSQHGQFASANVGASYEVALSNNDSGSAIGGIVSFVYEPSRVLQFSLNGRYLPHDFVSRHGGTFGESTDDGQNERGVYLGARYSPVKELVLSTYLDLTNTFVPPYLAQNNSKTTDLLLLAEYELSPTMRLTSRSKWKRKSEEERLDDSRVLGSRDQFNTRLEHDWQLSTTFRLRTRGEIVNVGYNNFSYAAQETGFLLSTNAKLRVLDMLDPELRVTWFNAPSYDSRLYVYENDLLGASGLTMLYGAGMRYSFILGLSVIKGVTLAAKYGITVYSQERDFGSGITQRNGKTSSKLGIQLELQF